MTMSAPPLTLPGVARHTSELIAIDTTNTGGPGTAGEDVAAQYIAAVLDDVGAAPRLISAAPGRTNVVLRIPGTTDGPGTVLHGHLDVVPAQESEWSVDPFGGVIQDGCVWGRGAVDMKGADAVMLSVAQRWLRSGERPRHDVVFAWVADEETGGALGAGHLTTMYPELFDGCDTAIGEVGGFGVPLGRGATLYPIMTGERAQARVRVTARGRSGHGSVAGSGNPVAILAAAVTALSGHRFPIAANDSIGVFLAGIAELWGLPSVPEPLEKSLARIGPLRALVEPALRATANPTMLRAGTAANVTPSEAQADFDCRSLPGEMAAFAAALPAIVGNAVELDVQLRSPGFSTPFQGPVVEAMTTALRAADPGALVLPYMVSASTDAPHFARLGMATFGFTPLQLPAGFPFGAMFHGPDERVPVSALTFGVEVLARFLRTR